MKFPALTKNEKLVIFSTITIGVFLWVGFVGYYLIKLKEINTFKSRQIDSRASRIPASTSILTPTSQQQFIEKPSYYTIVSASPSEVLLRNGKRPDIYLYPDPDLHIFYYSRQQEKAQATFKDFIVGKKVTLELNPPAGETWVYINEK